MDFLAIASSTETGPLVLYQALACGIPVISTPVGQVRELLGDEKAGLIVESSDVNSFKQRINQILNIPDFEYGQMQINARKIALEKLDLRTCQQKVIAVINEIDII